VYNGVNLSESPYPSRANSNRAIFQIRLNQDTTNSYRDLVYAHGGKKIVASASIGRGESALTVWELPSGKLLVKHTLRRPQPYLLDAICLLPDNEFVLLALRTTIVNRDGSFSDKAHLKLWDTQKNDLTNSIYEHDGHVRGVAVSPNGSLVAWASTDKRIRLYDCKKKQLLVTLPGHDGHAGSSAVAFSPNGRVLFSVGGDLGQNGEDVGTWKAWEVPSGKLLHTTIAHLRPATSLAVSPDGQKLATGSLEVKVWDIPETLRVKNR